MVRGVRQVERAAQAHDLADQAFAPYAGRRPDQVTQRVHDLARWVVETYPELVAAAARGAAGSPPSRADSEPSNTPTPPGTCEIRPATTER